MIRITLMDGTTQELPRESVRGVAPWRAPLQNPRLKSDGVIFYGGTLLPVQGPFAEQTSGKVNDRAWFLILEKSVQVIRGLPTFEDDISLNLVPEPKRNAKPPVLVAVTAEEDFFEAEAAFTAAPEAKPISAPAARTEEEEEAQVLQELEDLLRTA
ncbi:MAG: hypothetical protein EOP11_18800 [Proteobacteria bacterium]|nr:MAG: hypothetical protein EOP11_18800 [Pseudomonadota bacterium]